MPFPPILRDNRDSPRKTNTPVREASPDEIALLDAVGQRDLHSASRLLDNGVEVNCADHRLYRELVYCRSPLMLACAGGDRKLVKMLIEKGANPNQEDLCKFGCDRQENWMGANAIIYAMRGGPAFYGEDQYNVEIDLGLIELLVESGCNVNWTTGTNESPVGIAVKSDNLQAVRYLIKCGASPISCTDPNHTALRYAIWRSSSKMVTLLLDSGWDANERYPLDRSCPLKNATGARSPDDAVQIAEVLIAHGANVNAVPKDGCTALFSAISHQNENLVSLLLSKGADPNVINWRGQSCLDNARIRPSSSIVAVVEKHGGLEAALINTAKAPCEIKKRRKK